jgi:hypothetical protein
MQGRSARWSGLHEGDPAGWIGACAGCGLLFVLYAAHCDAEGYVVGWTCNRPLLPLSVTPLDQRWCPGRVRELPDQPAALAAWDLGGAQAVMVMVPLPPGGPGELG